MAPDGAHAARVSCMSRHVEFERLIAAADSAPVVFHCASGKDRTGIVAALVLTLLGVSRKDVVADFALTARATDRLVADWERQNPSRTMRWPSCLTTCPAGCAARTSSRHPHAERQVSCGGRTLH